MNRSVRILPLACAIALAACSGPKGNSPDVEPTGTPAAAAPETKPGLSLSGGKLVLPAVSGNPAAAYFTLVNGSPKPVTVAAVDVAGAGMAMLHETKDMGGHASMAEMAGPELKPGETLTLARGGKHVMIDGVPASWKPGGTAELTLTFADGDKLSAPLAIEAPGGE